MFELREGESRGIHLLRVLCASLAESVAAMAEERKVVTVLFCDVVGFTSRSERADPEDIRAAMRPYYQRLREEIEHYGGTVEKFIGDAVMAVFGAPVVHEDDAERAVRAGLRILQAIEELNEEQPGLDLSVRIGINTGEAVVELGTRPLEGEGMVTGDVVNTAARLQTGADPGAVVVGDQTYRATKQLFDYEELHPVTAKGKAEPVPARRAKAARARFGTDVVEGHAAPLVGRELERTLLTGTFERAVRDSSLQLVTVVGEPGVGKSRMVAELWSFVEDQEELVSWRQGRCLPYGEGITFWALGEIVKAQAGVLDSDGPEEALAKFRSSVDALVDDPSERSWLVAHLGRLIALSSETTLEQAEAFTAWRRYLEVIAATGPLVLVVEDLHWADEAMLAFVDHLVEWATGVPILVGATARPELYERRPHWGGGKRNTTTINLGPLSDKETSRLISSLMERAVLPVETQSCRSSDSQIGHPVEDRATAAVFRGRSEPMPPQSPDFRRFSRSGGSCGC